MGGRTGKARSVLGVSQRASARKDAPCTDRAALGRANASRPVRAAIAFAAFAAMAFLCAAVALIPCGQRAFAVEEPLNVEGNVVNTSQQPDSSFIYETSITDLAHADNLLDKQTVQITGEVVGDIVNASANSNYCWVTLQSTKENDDSVVAVYMGKQAASVIDTLGRYDAKGTILQVSGTFHLVCHDHEGISDIHATSVSVVNKGTAIDHPLVERHAIGALACVAVGAVMFLLYHILRERRR